MQPNIKAAFLDRDGVLNEFAPGKYVNSPSDFRLLGNVKPAVKMLNDAGFLCIVITNQQGVGLGYIAKETLDEIHAKMLKEFNDYGARIEAVYICPHVDGTCECRKPKPGMLLRAANDYNIDLSQSIMFGDSSTDIQAAEAAGCKAVRITNSFPLPSAVATTTYSMLCQT